MVTVPISSRAKVPGKVGPWRQAAGVGDTAVENSLVGWDGGGGGGAGRSWPWVLLFILSGPFSTNSISENSALDLLR